MKKSLLLAVLLPAVFSAEAQFQRTALLYGNVSYNNENNTLFEGNSVRARNFTFSPGGGYQFNRHFTIGAQASLSLGRVNDYGSRTTTTDFSAGPFLRYTHFFSEHFFVFGQLGCDYITGKQRIENKTTGIMNETIYNGVRPEFFPALGIHFSRGLSANISVGGLNYRVVDWNNSARHTDAFGITFGQELRIGISKNFGTRKNMSAKGSDPMRETRMLDTSDDPDDEDTKKPGKNDGND